jgi:hypothetical protein
VQDFGGLNPEVKWYFLGFAILLIAFSIWDFFHFKDIEAPEGTGVGTLFLVYFMKCLARAAVLMLLSVVGGLVFRPHGEDALGQFGLILIGLAASSICAPVVVGLLMVLLAFVHKSIAIAIPTKRSIPPNVTHIWSPRMQHTVKVEPDGIYATADRGGIVQLNSPGASATTTYNEALIANALQKMQAAIETSGNEDAKRDLQNLRLELQKRPPQKSEVKRLWMQLVEMVPAIKSISEAVTAIAGLFG